MRSQILARRTFVGFLVSGGDAVYFYFADEGLFAIASSRANTCIRTALDCNEAWLSPEQPNSIEQLRDGGYHTVNIGKVHAAPIRLPCGFNHRTVVENKNYKQGHHGPDGDPRD